MTRPARAFSQTQGQNVSPLARRSVMDAEETVPYERVRNGEMPPMMFQVRLSDGQIICFAYSDIREIRSRDAGHVQIGVFAMSRVMITIEGRHLRELTGLLGMGLIRWIQEADARVDAKPESAVEIVRVSVETADAK